MKINRTLNRGGLLAGVYLKVNDLLYKTYGFTLDKEQLYTVVIGV